MAIFTTDANDIINADIPDFLVDLIIRNQGTIQVAYVAIDWDEASKRALSAIDEGLQVQIEEHTRY